MDNNRSAKITDEAMWSTTEMPLTPEEEDTIVTLVVVVVGVLAAIIFLFSMGIFIDCRTQKNNEGSIKRKRLRLKMPALGRARRLHHPQHQRSKRDDSKYLATDMCPNGSSEYATPGSQQQRSGTSSLAVTSLVDAVV